MIPKEFQELEDHIEHKVRGIVDDHPLTRNLPEVARRNMAYVAAGSAISALTAEEIAMAKGYLSNDD